PRSGPPHRLSHPHSALMEWTRRFRMDVELPSTCRVNSSVVSCEITSNSLLLAQYARKKRKRIIIATGSPAVLSCRLNLKYPPTAVGGISELLESLYIR